MTYRRRRHYVSTKRRKQRNMIISICLMAVVFIAAAFWLLQPKEEENVASVKKEPVEGVVAEATSPYEVVINRSYPLESGVIGGSGELVQVGKFQLEKETADAYEKMMSAMKKEGLSVSMKSGYRTGVDQELLYERQIGRQGGDEIKAATVSALPLTSEHEAGLAIDFTLDGNLNQSFGSTKEGQWLLAHCAEYGFILRYPQDKTKITGIIWEPWHYRYVGSAKIAKELMDSGLVMEEYYGKMLKDKDIKPYLLYL